MDKTYVEELISTGFYKKVQFEELTGLDFIPHIYDSLAAARKAAEILEDKVVYLKRSDGKYTFVPISGDSQTLIYRVAKALGAVVTFERSV